MRSLSAAFVCILGLAACRSGAAVASYPGTDLPVFEEFRLRSAHGVQKSGQQFREGELRYSGEGEVVELFRRYAEAMGSRGWTHMAADVTRDRAVGRFRKDDRVARVELDRAGDRVFAFIKVVQAADPQVR